MNTEFEVIMKQVVAERERQNEKWGEQNHTDFVWLAILSEEIGEVSQALLHDSFGGRAAGTMQTELIQVAAVALQWLECIQRFEIVNRKTESESE